MDAYSRYSLQTSRNANGYYFLIYEGERQMYRSNIYYPERDIARKHGEPVVKAYRKAAGFSY